MRNCPQEQVLNSNDERPSQEGKMNNNNNSNFYLVGCVCKYNTRIKGFQPEPPEFTLEGVWAP